MGVSPISCGDPRSRSALSWSRVPVASLVRMPNSGAMWSMAIGSADEARLWCCYAADLDLVPPATSQAWQAELSEIARMLQGLRAHLSEP